MSTATTDEKERLIMRADKLAEDLRERECELMRLSDDELVQKTYALVTESERTSFNGDDWYWILSEIFERFAPDAELRNIDHGYRDDDDAEINTAASRQFFYGRQAARLAYQAAREASLTIETTTVLPLQDDR